MFKKSQSGVVQFSIIALAVVFVVGISVLSATSLSRKTITSILPSPIPTNLPCDSYGDVNMDRVVNSVDALFVSQFATGLKTLTPEQLLRADVNQDGKVTSADSDMILSYDVGTIKIFPSCQKKPPCGQYGDVNGNGYVNLRDFSLVLDNTLGKITLSDAQKLLADVNIASGKGIIDIFDAISIQDYVQGRQNSLPVCGAMNSPIPVM